MAKAARKDSSRVKRVQMDMPERSFKRLNRIQEITEATSYAEVVRNALRLYESLILEVEDGGEVFVRKKGTETKLHVFTA